MFYQKTDCAKQMPIQQLHRHLLHIWTVIKYGRSSCFLGNYGYCMFVECMGFALLTWYFSSPIS